MIQPGRQIQHLRKELLMPTELVLTGGILVVAAGGLVFVLLRRRKHPNLHIFVKAAPVCSIGGLTLSVFDSEDSSSSKSRVYSPLD